MNVEHKVGVKDKRKTVLGGTQNKGNIKMGRKIRERQF